MNKKQLIITWLIAILLLGGLGILPVLAEAATSTDGTVINYYEHGHEGPVLVFIHGWSCDASYDIDIRRFI
ncbi:MAG: alpha/beta hydrolase [Candidatus Omnitrophota bacterium]